MRIIKNKEELQILFDICNYTLNEDTCNLAHALMLKHVITYQCKKLKHPYSSEVMYELGTIPIYSDELMTMFYDTFHDHSIEFYVHANELDFINNRKDYERFYTRLYFNNPFRNEIRLSNVMSAIEKNLKLLKLLNNG